MEQYYDMNILVEIGIYMLNVYTLEVLKCKRPYLSIIKHLTKQNYHLYYSDWSLKINDKTIRTKKYVFIKK